MLAEMSENSKLGSAEVETMEEVMPELDILYMTRVQKERFLDEEFDRVKNSFVADRARNRQGGYDYPAPAAARERNHARREQRSPRSLFPAGRERQFVRMALILTLLRWADENKPSRRLPFQRRLRRQ